MLILKTFTEIFSFIDQSQSFNYRQIRQTDNASADYFKVIFRKKKKQFVKNGIHKSQTLNSYSVL